MSLSNWRLNRFRAYNIAGVTAHLPKFSVPLRRTENQLKNVTCNAFPMLSSALLNRSKSDDDKLQQKSLNCQSYQRISRGVQYPVQLNTVSIAVKLRLELFILVSGCSPFSPEIHTSLADRQGQRREQGLLQCFKLRVASRKHSCHLFSFHGTTRDTHSLLAFQKSLISSQNC